MIMVMPWPPAAQTEIKPLPDPFDLKFCHCGDNASTGGCEGMSRSQLLPFTSTYFAHAS